MRSKTSLAPPPEGDGRGRNPRRRKPPPEAKPAAKQPERGRAARNYSADQAGGPPAAGGGAAPLPRGFGGRWQGGPGGARERRAAPAEGAAGTAAPSAEKGPGTARARAAYLKMFAGRSAARKRSAEGWGGCAPSVGPDGPGPNAAPESALQARGAGEERGPAPPTNPQRAGEYGGFRSCVGRRCPGAGAAGPLTEHRRGKQKPQERPERATQRVTAAR